MQVIIFSEFYEILQESSWWRECARKLSESEKEIFAREIYENSQLPTGGMDKDLAYSIANGLGKAIARAVSPEFFRHDQARKKEEEMLVTLAAAGGNL